MLQRKQSVAAALANKSKALLTAFFRHNFQRLVKLSSQMRPAAHNRNGFGQLVVPIVAICVKITTPALQKLLGMLCFAAGLVIIQHNGMLCTPTCSV